MVESLGKMRKGRKERIERGSRERIEKERKERNKRELRRQFEEEEHHHLPLLELLQDTAVSSEDMSSRLDSAVKIDMAAAVKYSSGE